MANPLVTVELGTEQFQARAIVAAEPERTRLFKEIVKVRPGFGDYETKTTRVIPVVISSKRAGGSGLLARETTWSWLGAGGQSSPKAFADSVRANSSET